MKNVAMARLYRRGRAKPASVRNYTGVRRFTGCTRVGVRPDMRSMFVVRPAGNFVDDHGLASIEYGATVLGAFLIMVLGHNECGALKAAVDVVTKNAQLPGHLLELIAHLKAPVEKAQRETGSLV